MGKEGTPKKVSLDGYILMKEGTKIIPWNKGKKGLQVGWSKGKKLTNEHKKKLSEAHLGVPLSALHAQHSGEARLGHIVLEETRKKISKKLKGHSVSIDIRKKISKTLMGRNSGKNNPSWKGGKTSIGILIRSSREYKLWRQAVFERDSFSCIWCGDNKSGNLEADHIKPFAYFPELRYAIDNGRTLCKKCHRTTDTYGNAYRKKYSIE